MDPSTTERNTLSDQGIIKRPVWDIAFSIWLLFSLPFYPDKPAIHSHTIARAATFICWSSHCPFVAGNNTIFQRSYTSIQFITLL